MKLDRNINADRRCKYALILVRELDGFKKEHKVWDAIKVLEKEGIIRWGNESPDEAFFVLKYKDRFTAGALQRYALIVTGEATINENLTPESKASLLEYAAEIKHEAHLASIQGRKLPE
jgi:hypothetical protein